MWVESEEQRYDVHHVCFFSGPGNLLKGPRRAHPLREREARQKVAHTKSTCPPTLPHGSLASGYAGLATAYVAYVLGDP